MRPTRLGNGFVLAVTLAAWLSDLAWAGPWRFAVFGDTRGTGGEADPYFSPVILPELASAITNLSPRPDFLLIPGDLINSGSLAGFQAWRDALAPVYDAGISIYPVIGNHDANDPASFATAFGSDIPTNGPATELGRTYFVVHSNSLIFCLDTCVNLNRVNQPWIDSVLATNTRPHVFAQGHMPAFKAYHSDCLDDYPDARNAYWNSLRNAGCRIYFAGHDHFYNHARIDDGDGNDANDIHQMIVGSGGAPIYPSYQYDGTNSPYTPQLVYSEFQYGFVVVEVDGYSATATWHHRTGPNSYIETSEIFTYSIPVIRPSLSLNVANGRLTLAWTNGVLQTAPEAAANYSDVPDVTSPYTLTNLIGAGAFFRVRSF